MSTDWASTFDKFGIKKVTKTDKEKGAFVPNADQKAALTAAGFEPGDGGDNAVRLAIHILNDLESRSLDTSYYSALRVGANRSPEPRMGRDFIHWASLDDQIGIGNLGDEIYAWKVKAAELSLVDAASTIASTADPRDVLGKARQAKGKPAKQLKTISDFKRNLAVVAGALSRANGACEMPTCTSVLFKKQDGSNFLEVHHVVPLGEDGDDTLINAAALCPMCHRELHYGSQRLAKRKVLQNVIIAKEP